MNTCPYLTHPYLSILFVYLYIYLFVCLYLFISSYLILSYLILSYLIKPYHIISIPILPYLILSNLIIYFIIFIYCEIFLYFVLAYLMSGACFVTACSFSMFQPSKMMLPQSRSGREACNFPLYSLVVLSQYGFKKDLLGGADLLGGEQEFSYV